MPVTDETFTPDWYSPPGETVTDILNQRGMPIEEFARQMFMTPSKASRLLKGEEAIDPRMAVELSRVLGSTPRFWLRRERQYRADRRRIEGR
jgi:HTH-type transcriptional regulator / antitoxin HigA